MLRLPKDTAITIELLQKLLDEHTKEVNSRYAELEKVYLSDHKILHGEPKDDWKPDNRIVVNFPKFMVDTTNGFFIGNPIKTTAKEDKVAEYVDYLDQFNSQDDNNAELSKLCAIYGKGYEMYYTDENTELCITNLTPLEAFIVFDDSILKRPLFFIRRYKDYEGNEYGSISNSFGVRNFKVTGGLEWLDYEENEVDVVDGWKKHYFDGVPATEFVENEEKQGIFEPVLSMVNAYNKAISEKANDVDYFADAYLKILGALVENDDLKAIRNNRVINFEGDSEKGIIVEFMDKPSSDTTQENLLNRLERLIFCIGQTANTSDENFGTSSGIAMLYKMWSTNNRGTTKQRKFEKGMNRRYKMLFGHPASKVPADAWVQLHYTFTPNIPKNLLEETQVAANMEGITSHKTQLKVLSAVDNVQEELDEIEKENTPDENMTNKILGFGNTPQTETEETTEDLNNE
jgi:SPP1 family phage portal protein